MIPGSGRDWLFAAKAFAASMLALGIGFAADLDRPYWAMATVYITFQPFAGPTRAKATYRLLGTVLGSAAALALVPNLVVAPVLLSVALAGWVALCLTLSLLDRTPRGYVFMLAGYTAAIVGFPSVTAPDAIWTTAIARTEEIGLGIVCAALVASVVFPRHLGPDLSARTEAWLRDGRRWAVDVLRERPAAGARADRELLAADAVEIAALATQLDHDGAGHAASARAIRALHARLLMVLPLLSSIADRLAALRRAGALSPGIAELLGAIAAWLDAGQGAAEAARLRETIGRLESQAGAGSVWDDVMRAGLLARLRELVLLFQDSARLQAHVRTRRPGLPALAGGHENRAAALQHADIAMAAYSGLAAGLAVLLVCAFWIAGAWPDGAVAAEMAAVGACFFAARDDPAPAILQFLRYTVVTVLVDGVYLFALLPGIDGFVLLAAALAPVFLVYGVLIARPATMPVGMALAANGATLLALQGSYSASLPGFVNSSLAAVTGMAMAAVLTRLIRSVGAEWSTWRLVRANWRDLARAARRRGGGDRAAFAGLLLDRIGLVVMRLGRLGPALAPDTARLQGDLRIGLNIVDLRRARHGLPSHAVQAIDAALDALAGHYEGLARRHERDRHGLPGAALLQAVDAAITTVALAPGGALRRDALLGLAGIRLGLYPAAAAHLMPPLSSSLLQEAV